MSAESALHNAIVAALRADSTIASLLAVHAFAGSPSVPAVYDYVPQSETPESSVPFPYVVVGDATATEFDTDELNGQEHTLTLHIWDRYRGGKNVRAVQAAIYSVLHARALNVSGQNAVYCYFEYSGSVPDPDVLTQHAVARYRVVTMEG